MNREPPWGPSLMSRLCQEPGPYPTVTTVQGRSPSLVLVAWDPHGHWAFETSKILPVCTLCISDSEECLGVARS